MSTVNLSWGAVTDPTVSGAVTSGVDHYVIMRSLENNTADPSATVVGTSTGTTFADTNPPQLVGSSNNVFYFVQAVDVAGNASDWSPGLAVTLPPIPPGPLPTAVLTVPSTITQGTSFTADGSGSVPGTSGTIIAYTFNFGDGTVVGPSTTATVRHTYNKFYQYPVTLTVTDSIGQTASVTQTIVSTDLQGLTWPSGAQKIIPGSGAPRKAADVNGPLDVHEQLFVTLQNQMQQLFAIVSTGKTVAWRSGSETFTPPTGIAEFQSTNKRRMPFDFTGQSSLQMFVDVANNGPTVGLIGMRFSIDGGTTWNNMDGSATTGFGGEAVSVATAGSFVGPWIQLSPDAQTDTIVQLIMGNSSDGTTAASTFLIGFRTRP